MLYPRHIRILKRAKKHKEIRTTKPNKDLDYLYEKGYIEINICDKPGDYFAQPYLTELGKARLYEEKRKLIEVWLPVAISTVISLCALIISVIALMK